MANAKNKPEDDNHDSESDEKLAKRGAEAQRRLDKKASVGQRYKTKDGTPVETSTLPPKYPIGQPDVDARDDIVPASDPETALVDESEK